MTPRVAVVIPALNEEATIAGVVEACRRGLDDAPVADIIVVDPDSTDRTAEVARTAGARVIHWRDDVHPRLTGIDPLPGKGEALLRGTAAAITAGADIVCFLDGDVANTGDDWVTRLVTPLVGTWDDSEPVRLVKGYYRRDLEGDTGGGRVTELTARPLLAALRPGLADIRQPLSGEYAARCDTLARCRFPVDYGVEIAVLIQVHDRHGRAAIAEADLGARRHRNRSLAELGLMSRQVTAAAFAFCGVPADPAFTASAGLIRDPLVDDGEAGARGVVTHEGNRE